MWSALLLGGALALGQQPAPPSPSPTEPGQQPPKAADAEKPPEPEKADELPAAPERWALMRLLQGTWYGATLEQHRVAISGWTEGSFTASSARQNQLPMGFNYLANDFLLQNNWLRIDRPVDTDAKTLTWGFRSDTILPGSDYRFTIARGLFSGQLTSNNGGPELYGIDPVQFYAELYLPNAGKGLSIKLGRFFALFGVESIDPTQNPLASRSYTFIYNPFTHTGLVTTLQLNDDWSVQNGIVTGSDMFIGPEANATYIGGVKWAPPEGKDSFLFSVIAGKGRYDAANAFSNPEVFDIVYTHKFSDKLSYSLDALYSFQTDFPGSGFVNNWGVVQYLTYAFTDRLSGTTRLEFFDDCQGQRTGFEGLYTAVTAGVTYKPLPGLWLRPEVRYDHNGRSRPFAGKPSLFTAAFDCIIRW